MKSCVNAPTKTALGCLFVLSAWLYACQSNPVLPDLPPDHYVLKEGVLFPATAEINIIADTVNLSICPIGAACFAPDNASASVRIIQDTQIRSVRLFTWFSDVISRATAPSANDSTSIQLDGQRYKVILKARYTTNNEKGKTGQAILQFSRL